MPKIAGSDIDMELDELLAVYIRDKFFDGNWNKFLKSLENLSSPQWQHEDIPLILQLKGFEQKHNVNLGEHLPDGWREFRIPKWLYKGIKKKFKV